MQIGRVIGDVVATRKDAAFAGVPLLLVQPLGAERQPQGRPIVAVDSVGAGVGEHVFFVRGKEASFPFHPTEMPADAGIVGILDHWTLGGTMILARVVGQAVATVKRPQFEGATLLLVQPETPDGAAIGTTLLAVDGVGAGVSERVLVVVEGRAAAEILGKKLAPVDAAIVGIVDRVDVEG